MRPYPLVSVVISAYNVGITIGETINSVLCQSFNDFELILVDDGSTDNTAEIIHKYQDERIIYHYQSNRERSEARNRGITIARGEFIAFLDADDLWMPCKLEKQIHMFEKNVELGLIYSDLYYFDNQTGKNLFLYSNRQRMYKGTVPISSIIKNNYIQSPTPLIRKEIFSKVGFFDTNFNLFEDWDMWIRIVAKYPIDYVDIPLAKYRIHNNTVTWEKSPELMYWTYLRLLDKTEQQLIPQNIANQSTIDEARAYANYKYGKVLSNKGNYADAMRLYFNAIELTPFSLNIYFNIIRKCFSYLYRCIG